MAELYEELGLKKDEYDSIVEVLEREPNKVELGMYSVMRAEHCSYKSSKEQLRKLPTTGPRILRRWPRTFSKNMRHACPRRNCPPQQYSC